jgi:NADH-quinone oxidoreductase subunit L
MNNIGSIVWLIPLLPLVGFLITGLGRKVFSKSISGLVASGVILASFAISLLAFLQVKAGTVIDVHYFNLINIEKFIVPVAFKIDQLSSLFLLVITGVGFLIHVYSTSYMHDEEAKDFSKYFSYLNLFVFSMLLLVMGNNFVVMFFGWEGVGLCSYLLIGYWFTNNDYTNAAKKAFIMNRIGDLGFLLALFWLIAKVGSVTYTEVFTQASLAKLSSTDITGITALMFLGACGKSAQIPLYTWLPDAMAGPTPVSALIHAATMVTAGIYMIARSNIMFTMAPATLSVVAVFGLATAIVAATIALKQNDIKKVLAYSTVSQLGYMFLGLGVASYTGAVFHVITHAFFKALLFLGAGSVIHAIHGQQDMRFMGGLKKYMPTTHVTFLIGCIAIAGMPPFSGFFSKDEILAAAYSANPILWVIGVIGAVMTAFYMFRLYSMTFLGDFRGTEKQKSYLHESPSAITIPLIVLAILAIVAGFIGIPAVFKENSNWLANFLSPIFKDSNVILAEHHGHLSHSTEYMLMGISVAAALAAIIFSVSIYKKYNNANAEKPQTAAASFLENKWYFDELYQTIIVNPIQRIGNFFTNIIEKKGIDGGVNGVGKLVNYGSRQLRLLQDGQVGVYLLLMVLGIIALFILQLFIKK